MEIPKTMAMKITEKNWSVVAALCPDQLERNHQANFFGRYIVINVPVVISRTWTGPMLTLQVTTLTKEEFKRRYAFAFGKKAKDAKNSFVEVEEIIMPYRVRRHSTPLTRVSSL
jgi:hypothetical protein